MLLYDFLRKCKGKYKEYAKERAGRYLSPVRRLERVAPPSSGRFVAMTFDDGPTSMKTNPPHGDMGLTEVILDTLKKYDAHGTFDVIGTTEYNYPDVAGELGSFSWGGVEYDHYPDFGMDERAGVKNQPELVKQILDEGHELTNHGWRHILFGKSPIVYGNRKSFDGISDVISDLGTLHKAVEGDFGFKMKMSRPPHYVDKMKDGHTAYDAYRYMNYQYMAASFDGGGWQVSGDYQKDVEAMVSPLRQALESNPDSLNGQIIFQKDGCNMSKETPVADGLAMQLELLCKHGYKVVTVSELVAMSPFEDLSDSDSLHPYAASLINRGYCVARKNNRLYPDRRVTIGELITMCVPPSTLHGCYCEWVDGGFKVSEEYKKLTRVYRISPSHPYFHSIVTAVRLGILSCGNEAGYRVGDYVSAEILYDILSAIDGGICASVLPSHGRPLTVREILPCLAGVLLKD